MQELLARVLEAERAITGAGPGAGGALLLTGAILLVLGHHAFRAAAALIGGLVGVIGMQEWIRQSHPHLPVSSQLTIAVGALIVFSAGILWPHIVTIGSSGIAAFVVALRLTPAGGSNEALLLIWTGALALGVLVPAALYNMLPMLIVPPMAALFVTAGAWGLYGTRYSAEPLYSVPAVWVTLALLITLCSWMIENHRILRTRPRAPVQEPKPA
jgi:hypothetical protein